MKIKCSPLCLGFASEISLVELQRVLVSCEDFLIPPQGHLLNVICVHMTGVTMALVALR